MGRGMLLSIMIVMLFVELLLNGYTLSVLWSWFIVNKFGLPSLAIAEAFGLAIVVGYFTFDLNETDWHDDSSEEKAARYILVPFLKVGMFLGFGWVILQFV